MSFLTMKRPGGDEQSGQKRVDMADYEITWFNNEQTQGRAHRDLFIPDPTQPRADEIKEKDIQEIAASFDYIGQLEPIVVKSFDPELGKFPIIAGETRWRAAFVAGNVSDLEFKVRGDADDDPKLTLTMQLVENIQRSKVPALKQAEAIFRLLEFHNGDREQVGRALGKNKTFISHAVTSFEADRDVKAFLTDIGTHDIQLSAAITRAYKKDRDKTLELMTSYKQDMNNGKGNIKLREEAGKISAGKAGRTRKSGQRVRASRPLDIQIQNEDDKIILHISGKERDARYILDRALLDKLKSVLPD